MWNFTATLYADVLAAKVKHTVYRNTVKNGVKTWVTKITNNTVGDLWFPLYGQTSNDITDPTATLKVASLQSLGPDELTAIYDSPSPLLPLEIVAISDYAGDRWDDGGTDSSMDVSTRKPGDARPIIEVILTLDLPPKIDFTADLDITNSQLYNDGCNRLFQLVGGAVALRPIVRNLVAVGTVQSTTYTWTVKGGSLATGILGPTTDASPITVSLDRPGTLLVTLDVTVTSQLGAGAHADVETATSRASYKLEVLTTEEANFAAVLCKLQQETLPIPTLVFPGDPARVRNPAELVAMRERFEARATAFLKQLNHLIATTERR